MKIDIPGETPRMKLTDIPCKRCGTFLYVYTGESIKQWDIEYHEFAECHTGETMPCHNCRRNQSILFSICAEVDLAHAMAIAPTPPKMTNEAYRPKRERYERQYEETKAVFTKRCEELGFYADQIRGRYHDLKTRARASRSAA